jgi:hypothetical protein
MLAFVVAIRPYLEVLYFMSGVVVAIAACVALQQVRLLKMDMNVRNERASKEFALASMSRFSKECLTMQADFYVDCVVANVPFVYEGPIGSFQKDSISPEWVKICELRKKSGNTWLHMLNNCDDIAAAFVTGVADEVVGFNGMGKSFCSLVESTYDLVSIFGERDVHHSLPNIVKLYGIWSKRFSKMELEAGRVSAHAQLTDINSKLACVPDERVPPIGVDRGRRKGDS